MGRLLHIEVRFRGSGAVRDGMPTRWWLMAPSDTLDIACSKLRVKHWIMVVGLHFCQKQMTMRGKAFTAILSPRRVPCMMPPTCQVVEQGMPTWLVAVTLPGAENMAGYSWVCSWLIVA